MLKHCKFFIRGIDSIKKMKIRMVDNTLQISASAKNSWILGNDIKMSTVRNEQKKILEILQNLSEAVTTI